MACKRCRARPTQSAFSGSLIFVHAVMSARVRPQPRQMSSSFKVHSRTQGLATVRGVGPDEAVSGGMAGASSCMQPILASTQAQMSIPGKQMPER